MGQYFMIVNIDKKEYIHPHRIGAGLKFWEICANNSARVVPFLLRRSAEGGGGDADEWFEPSTLGRQEADIESTNTCGRWAGDRIVITGDYDKDDQQITEAEARAYGYGEDNIKKDKLSNGMIKCNLYILAQVRFKEISQWVARDFNKFIGGAEMEVEYSPPRDR